MCSLPFVALPQVKNASVQDNWRFVSKLSKYRKAKPVQCQNRMIDAVATLSKGACSVVGAEPPPPVLLLTLVSLPLVLQIRQVPRNRVLHLDPPADAILRARLLARVQLVARGLARHALFPALVGHFRDDYSQNGKTISPAHITLYGMGLDEHWRVE